MPPKAFKPPRPSASAGTSSAAAPSKTSKSKARTSTSSTTASSSRRISKAAASPPQSPDPFSESAIATASAGVSIAETEKSKATIPAELLTRLVHEFFVDPNMRISKSADRAVGIYLETFVREAIARAAYERAGGLGVADDGFLEVEDLEKLAPQLLLDF